MFREAKENTSPGFSWERNIRKDVKLISDRYNNLSADATGVVRIGFEKNSAEGYTDTVV